jgi:hypothetical protein
MKLVSADTRSRSTEVTAATVQSQVQTPKKLTAFFVSARNFKNPKPLKPVATNRLNTCADATQPLLPALFYPQSSGALS